MLSSKFHLPLQRFYFFFNNNFINFRYKFFDNAVLSPNDSISLHPLSSSGIQNTPTAPRTPESSPESG